MVDRRVALCPARALGTARARQRRGACSSAPQCTRIAEESAGRQKIFSRSCLSSFLDGARLRFGGFLLPEVLTKALDHVEGDWNEEDRQYGGCEHAADHNRAQHLSRNSARPGGSPQRNAAKNEGERRHKDGAQTQPCASESGVDQSLAAVVFHLGEFDNQNGVLGGQADQHDQSDLGINVVVKAPEVECDEGAEHCDGDAEQHAEGKRPTLVLRSHDQEDDKECEAKNYAGGNALRCLLLLVRHAAVVEAHLAGHGFVEDVLERRHYLAGAVAGRRRGVDLHAVEQVVTHDELCAAARIRASQCAQRNHIACSVADVELAQVRSLGAEVTVRLDIDLPLQAEAVEVIDQRAAHKRLYGLVQTAQLDLLRHRLGVVNLNSDLRNTK